MTYLASIAAIMFVFAESLSPAFAEDSFASIHLDNQKVGSEVWKVWHPLSVDGTEATWQLKTAVAYLQVYSFYCAPGLYSMATSEGWSTSMEVALYTDALRVDYDGDCRAFYIGEVAPRFQELGIEFVTSVQG
jgi:hypothetical protein